MVRRWWGDCEGWEGFLEWIEQNNLYTGIFDERYRSFVRRYIGQEASSNMVPELIDSQSSEITESVADVADITATLVSKQPGMINSTNLIGQQPAIHDATSQTDGAMGSMFDEASRVCR